jgi:asparagine synthase (glutamine-hydrolysing)
LDAVEKAAGVFSDVPIEEQERELIGELSRSVEEQMAADVPLGAFLSGGLDSSLIVALMQASGRTRDPVRSFAVGYSQQDLAFDVVPDDLPYARRAARLLGARNTEIVLAPEMSDVLPDVVWHLDEPLGDPAAISSYLICRAAKAELTVLLSGVGGDELFAGYPRQKAMMYGGLYRRAPRFARESVQRFARRLPGAGSSFAAKLGRSANRFLEAVDGGSIHHYVGMETYFSSQYQEIILAPDGPIATAEDPSVDEYSTMIARIERLLPGDPVKQALLLDLVTYLPNLNLAYTDRTSMANSVEVRVPFLDIRLVEWALVRRSSDLLRWRRGRLEGKWLLKRAARACLPDEIIWRKKAGFGAPVRSWLRSGLREMCAELLGPRGLASRGWFADGAIAQMQEEFAAGHRDHALRLWMLMSLELWARRYT